LKLSREKRRIIPKQINTALHKQERKARESPAISKVFDLGVRAVVSLRTMENEFELRKR